MPSPTCESIKEPCATAEALRIVGYEDEGLLIVVRDIEAEVSMEGHFVILVVEAISNRFRSFGPSGFSEFCVS